MVKLHAKEIGDGPHLVPDVHPRITNLDSTATLEDELDAMVETLQDLVETTTPDVLMSTCMSFQARLTEIHLQLVRIEAQNRRAKQFRTSQLQRVMELVEFTFKGASRLIELRRQELELTR